MSKKEVKKDNLEKLHKSIDSVIEDFFKSEEEVVVESAVEDKKVEEVAKSFDENFDEKSKKTDISVEANGGGDVIKNKDCKDSKMEKLKKESDSEEDMEEKDEKKKKAKKSFEVSEADYERLQKALKDDEEKTKAEQLANDPVIKSMEALADKLNELTNKVEALSKSPARQPKGLNGLQPLEKSETSNETNQKLVKSQVLPIMLEMQEKGLLGSDIVCEYEASGNISNSFIKSQVADELRKRKLLS